MFEEYPEILTVEEACEALRIGENAIYELLGSDKLRGFRNGRVWRIPRTSLREYVLTSIGIKNKGDRST